MKERFGSLLETAAETGLPDWDRHYNGLAAVLLMDQFSRQDNSYVGHLALLHAMQLCSTHLCSALPLSLLMLYPPQEQLGDVCRNVYRGTPKMFALDSTAIAKARALIVSISTLFLLTS